MATRIALLAALVTLAIVPAASAATALTPFSTAGEATVSDGPWAAIASSPGMLVVDGRGSGMVRRQVDIARACGASYAGVRAVGSGRALVQCGFRIGDLEPRLLVYDLRALTFVTVPGTRRIMEETFEITGVGRRWIAVTVYGHNDPTGDALLLDWRDGRAIRQTTALDRVVDPDAAAGSRPLCRSLRRPSRRAPFSYEAPFALTQLGAGAGARLVLERCGGRSRTLTRASQGGVAGELGTRFVAWSDRERVHARSLRSGRELSWPVPAGQTYVLGLAIVGRHLLVTITGGPFGGPGTGGFTVYRARLY